MNAALTAAEAETLLAQLRLVFENAELVPLQEDRPDGLRLRVERRLDDLCVIQRRRIWVDGAPCELRLTGILAEADRNGPVLRQTRMFWEDLYRDALTGAYNLDCWNDRVAGHVTARARDGLPAAIALIDIDGLTALNTAYGRADADQLIGYAANQWKRYYDEPDNKVVCRIGPGRLGIFCAGADERDLEEQLRWLYTGMPLVCSSTDGMFRRIPFTLSIACAGLNERPGASLAELMALCEERLAAVQKAGGNAVAAAEG